MGRFVQIVLLSVLSISSVAFGQEFEERPTFPAKHPIRIQVYTGGPSLLKSIVKFSENYQDKVTFSNGGMIGGEIDFKPLDWLSVGIDCSYRHGQINFGIYDSTFFQDVRDKWDIDMTNIVDPFGSYEMKVPRFRGMAKVNFHVLKPESKSDLYFTVGVGYNRSKPRLYKDGEELKFFKRFTTLSLPMAYRTSVGYTFHPIENLGVFAEVGIGGPIVSAGISARF